LVSIINGSLPSPRNSEPDLPENGSVAAAVLLVLSEGAVRLGEDVIGEHLAGTGRVREHAVEDAPPAFVLVHAELDKVP
jgi:hypothetical protein